MNSTLKQALLIIVYIFFFGIAFKNPEIQNVVKGGIGNILMSIGIIIGIASFFPFNVGLKDKFICLFWAGALFFFGAGLHKLGLTFALAGLSAYIILISLYFSIFINSSTFKALVILAIGLFSSAYLLLYVGSTSPDAKIMLERPTEIEEQPDAYDYQIKWSLWCSKSHKNSAEFPLEFHMTNLVGTIKEANLQSDEIIKSWEIQNPTMEINKKELVFIERVK